MQVISKSGLKLALEISGTQEEPVIILEPIPGKPAVKGPCHIAASQKRTIPGVPAKADSLFVEAAKGFLQMDLKPIYEAIAALPHKVYMARKVAETRNLDGDVCPTSVWKWDTPECCIVSPKTGAIIGGKSMARFLDGQGITEIEISKAAQMWSEVNETPEKLQKKAAESAKFAAITQHWADMEEMENGHALSEDRDPTSMYPREGQ
ncbi:hypothetical protein M0R72_17010 [Candidatus Pacearchaeota archaeon]|jgi:hypothetical protein|nr:hypothetical protein [Candidatus Pacearchaeota archaeon]